MVRPNFRVGAPRTKPVAKEPKPRLTAAERAKAKATKEKNHETYVRRTYSLDAGEYQRLLASQGGACAICAKKPRKRYLAVDHDHFSGAVRGLLCYFCNSAIGVFEFNRDTARRASDYLARIEQDFDSHPLEPSGPGVLEKNEHDDLPF